MGISKPSQGCAKHQKDMAVLNFYKTRSHYAEMALINLGVHVHVRAGKPIRSYLIQATLGHVHKHGPFLLV